MSEPTQPAPQKLSLKLSLASLYLFEKIDHPFTRQSALDENQKPVAIPVTGRDLIHAIYICHDPRGAFDALRVSRDEFEKNAVSLAADLPIDELKRLQAAIIDMSKEIPGTQSARQQAATK